jgi:GSH-dependent disulfide-bond oxidoreductase
VAFATGVLEAHLSRQQWICGASYSLGDINGFNLGYALPLSQPERCNDQKTPHIMEWLRKIYERPATRETWAKGRTPMAARVTILERAAAGATRGSNA